MRDIKFRAWDKARGQMATYELGYAIGISLDGSLDVTIEEVRGDEDISRTWCKDSEDLILMQYTGLKDKNGTEIYEGDVVKYVYLPGKGFWNCDKVHIIKWENTGFKMEPLPGKGGFNGWLSGLPGAYMPNCQELFEVIGNIYENPELMEKTT